MSEDIETHVKRLKIIRVINNAHILYVAKLLNVRIRVRSHFFISKQAMGEFRNACIEEEQARVAYEDAICAYKKFVS